MVWGADPWLAICTSTVAPFSTDVLSRLSEKSFAVTLMIWESVPSPPPASVALAAGVVSPSPPPSSSSLPQATNAMLSAAAPASTANQGSFLNSVLLQLNAGRPRSSVWTFEIRRGRRGGWWRGGGGGAGGSGENPRRGGPPPRV